MPESLLLRITLNVTEVIRAGQQTGPQQISTEQNNIQLNVDGNTGCFCKKEKYTFGLKST